MKYTQPELTVLGQATDLVKFGGTQKNPAGGDACISPGGLCPAHELDD